MAGKGNLKIELNLYMWAFSAECLRGTNLIFIYASTCVIQLGALSSGTLCLTADQGRESFHIMLQVSSYMLVGQMSRKKCWVHSSAELMPAECLGYSGNDLSQYSLSVSVSLFFSLLPFLHAPTLVGTLTFVKQWSVLRYNMALFAPYFHPRNLSKRILLDSPFTADFIFANLQRHRNQETTMEEWECSVVMAALQTDFVLHFIQRWTAEDSVGVKRIRYLRCYEIM